MLVEAVGRASGRNAERMSCHGKGDWEAVAKVRRMLLNLALALARQVKGTFSNEGSMGGVTKKLDELSAEAVDFLHDIVRAVP